MIACAQKDGKPVFIPLIFDPDHDEWIPVSDATFATPMQAAKALYAFLLEHLKAFILSARKLRALTEHPGFQELDADGISADVICDEARHLAELIELRTQDLTHLLDEPNQTDKVSLSRHFDSTPPRQRTSPVVQTKRSRKPKAPKHRQGPAAGAAVPGRVDLPSQAPAPPSDGHVDTAEASQSTPPPTGARAPGKRRFSRRDADPYGLRKLVRDRLAGHGSGSDEPGGGTT